jgi:hypothetical protein
MLPIYEIFHSPLYTTQTVPLVCIHALQTKLMSGKLRDIGITRFLCLHRQFFLRPQPVSYNRSVSQLQRTITTRYKSTYVFM